MSKQLASHPNKSQWMVVYITHNVNEAHIVAGRLESEDIPAMVNQALGASALGISIGSLGEVKVLVRPVDYDRALGILHPAEAAYLPEDTDQIIFDPTDDERDGK